MYFVTIGGQAGYVLFSMTPRGRAAIGVTNEGTVRLLEPIEGGEWQVLREWPVAVYSHTELMVAASRRSEPARAEELLELLPPETLG